jgi:hypothetical protein
MRGKVAKAYRKLAKTMQLSETEYIETRHPIYMKNGMPVIGVTIRLKDECERGFYQKLKHAHTRSR